MLSAIRSDTFKVEGRQEDAEEFLSCLLNGLHDEMFEVSLFEVSRKIQFPIAEGGFLLSEHTYSALRVIVRSPQKSLKIIEVVIVESQTPTMASSKQLFFRAVVLI